MIRQEVNWNIRCHHMFFETIFSYLPSKKLARLSADQTIPET